MRILGIDPGATTGWVIYDDVERRVYEHGKFDGHNHPWLNSVLPPFWDHAVIERPKGYGPTYPQVVDAAYVTGRLVEWLRIKNELVRRDVCRILSDAVDGVIRVKNDATAWAALLELHGGTDASKKGGCFYGVKAHERAALAVAVAFAIQVQA